LETKKKKRTEVLDSEEESDVDSLLFSVSDFSDEESIKELTDDQEISTNDYVLVKFPSKKNVIYYIGKIQQIVDMDEYQVKFLRRKSSYLKFFYPDVDDVSEVNRQDIFAILPPPPQCLIKIELHVQISLILENIIGIL
jgi:hypothetical protein